MFILRHRRIEPLYLWLVALAFSAALLGQAFRPIGQRPAGLAASETPAPQVTLEIQPAEVSLWPLGQGQVTVVARNLTDQPIHQVNLTVVTENNPEITAVMEPKSDPNIELTLSPFGSLFWTVTLNAQGGAQAGKVQLRLAYQQNNLGGSAATAPGLSFADLNVTFRAPETAENTADVTIQTTLQSLDELHTGTLYIVVRNKSNHAITVTSVDLAQTPTDITAKQDKEEKDIVLEPGVNHIYVFTVTTSAQINPGKYLLLFNTQLTWPYGTQTAHGNITSSQEVTVGVFGESAILQVLALPTILLVPGFIIVLMIQALWSVGKTKEKRQEFLFRSPEPLFWLAVISGSLLMVKVLYGPMAQWILNKPLTILPAYSFNDIAYLWGFSLLVGVTIYAGWGLGAALVSWAKRAYQWLRVQLDRQLQLTGEDEPEDALKKYLHLRWNPVDALLRKKVSSKMEKVKFKLNGADTVGFLLEPVQDGKTKYWVGALVNVHLSEDAANALNPPDPVNPNDLTPEEQQQEQRRKSVESAQDAVIKAITDSVDLQSLLNEIEGYRPLLVVKWQSTGQLTYPRQVDLVEPISPEEDVMINFDFSM
jgi:hypothetical protein